MPAARTVVMALQFPPRGGSAQVVRYLAPEITAAGWSVSLVAGSLGVPGDLGFAPEFFAPLPVTPVDDTDAMRAWAMGGDPLAGPCPLHPSFEDRDGAPDRVFATLDDAAFERQVSSWSTALVAGGIGAAAVAHLHHLTRSTRPWPGCGRICRWYRVDCIDPAARMVVRPQQSPATTRPLTPWPEDPGWLRRRTIAPAPSCRKGAVIPCAGRHQPRGFPGSLRGHL